MKVLNVNKYFQHTGGGDRFFFDTARILEENGHQVFPFCLAYPGNDPTTYARYFPEGIRGTDIQRQSTLTKARAFLNGIYSFDAKRAVEKMVDELKPDVAHLHVLHFTMSPSVIDALHAKGVPIIFSLHDYRFACASGYLFTEGAPCQRCRGHRYFQAVRHRCYKNAVLPSLMATIGNYLYRVIGTYRKVDLFTVPHEEMAGIVRSFGLPENKIRVLKNPFYLDTDANTAKIDKYVLFYGNLSAQKGIFTLAKAAQSAPEIPFVVCGDGPARDEFAKYVADNQIANIRLDTTTRWRTGLPAMIKAARLVVSPSEWPTPMEYSTLEAMALGKTVLASRIGGNQAVIEDGKTGFLFRPADSRELSDKIRKLYADAALCERVGAQAKQYVHDAFEPRAYYRQLADIYEEAMQS